jgi:hypothetical protein
MENLNTIAFIVGLAAIDVSEDCRDAATQTVVEKPAQCHRNTSERLDLSY